MKVSFLFGAGAEGRGNFGMPTGLEFLRLSFFREERSDKQFDALKLFFEKTEGNIYSRNVYNDSNTEKVIFNNLLNRLVEESNLVYKENKDRIDRFLKNNTGNESRDLIKSFWNHFHNNEAKNLSEGDESLINSLFENVNGKFEAKYEPAISSILDVHFHTIIDPVKFGKIKFSKLFNYYWNSYFIILESILKNGFVDKELFESDGETDYSKILNNLQEITNILYNLSTKQLVRKKDGPGISYYEAFANYFDRSDIELKLAGVLTTNYFRFVEIMSKESERDIAYLSGKMSNFEVPHTLDVVDLSRANFEVDNELFFPFILGQSYIKPIISPVQIEEYCKMSKILKDSDVLVILGYNINEDDNHVNAYLSDYIRNGKKVVIVTDSGRSQDFYKKRLRLSDSKNISVLRVNYGNNEKVVESVLDFIINLG